MDDERLQTFRLFVRGLFLNQNREVLLLKKQMNQSIGAGKWLPPGGAIEFGESAEDALRRELLEEVGLRATSLSLVGEAMRIIDRTHWQGLIYLVHGDLSEVRNCEPGKHERLEWRSVEFARSVLSKNESDALTVALAR